MTIDLDLAALGSAPDRALAGGEDHALLATFPTETVPQGFRTIGRVVEQGEHPLVAGDQPLRPEGWDPYRDWDSTVS